jgi:hypothetical protein
VIFALIGAVAWPLISIQFRLWRNGAVATKLVTSLQARFPEGEFRGAASYQREVVYIRVLGGVRPECRPDVEQWLRRLKVEQEIAPSIWLLFPEFSGEEKNAIKL